MEAQRRKRKRVYPLTKLFYTGFGWHTHYCYQVMALPFDWDKNEVKLVIRSKWDILRYRIMTFYLFLIFSLKLITCIQAYMKGNTKLFAFGIALICASAFVWIFMFIIAIKCKHVLVSVNEIVKYHREFHGKKVLFKRCSILIINQGTSENF